MIALQAPVPLHRISGDFDPAMIRTLAKGSRSRQVIMARPNEADRPPKCAKMIQLGIYRGQIRPSEQDIIEKS